jgi:hypothetical protein
MKFKEQLELNIALADVGQLPDEFYKKYPQATQENVALYTLDQCIKFKRDNLTTKAKINSSLYYFVEGYKAVLDELNEEII